MAGSVFYTKTLSPTKTCRPGRRSVRGLYTAIAFLLSLAGTGANALPFSNLVVLGDSLSDTGNVRAALGPLGDILSVGAGYGDNGRFSNGPVWHEYLADSLGIPRASNSEDGGTNYAYGGARVDNAANPSAGVLTQESRYLADLGGATPDPDALYVTWAGGNDMRDLVGTANPVSAIDSALDSLTGVVSRLITSGVSTLLVPNLPDLGSIPEFAGSADASSATSVTASWNDGLLGRMTSLATTTSASIFFLDVFSLFDELLATPGDFGFSNTTGECRSVTTIAGIPVAENSCANPGEFVFWDEIHPTTATHQVLGDEAFALLGSGEALGVVGGPQDVFSPATLLLLIGGLLLLATRHRGALTVAHQALPAR